MNAVTADTGRSLAMTGIPVRNWAHACGRAAALALLGTVVGLMSLSAFATEPKIFATPEEAARALLDAAASADCTSCAAASMLRSSRNCSVIWVAPSTLVELIESSPAINENCPSRGVATLDAMVSASAPGRDAFTTIVGKSTFGSSFTGREKYPNRPASKKASMTRMVMTGRLMKTSEIFMSSTHNGAGMPLFDNARARQSVA